MAFSLDPSGDSPMLQGKTALWKDNQTINFTNMFDEGVTMETWSETTMSDLDVESANRNIFTLVFLPVVGVVILFGNFLVVLAIIRRPELQVCSITLIPFYGSLYLSSLAVA